MKKLSKVLVLAGLVSMFAAPVAMAGPRLSLVGVGVLGMPTSTILGASAVGLAGKFTFGGGALIELPIGSRFGLEIGGLYYNRSFDIDGQYITGGTTGTAVTTSYNVIEVPVTAKVWFTRMIYLSLGGYVSSGMGGVTQTPAGGTGSVGSFGSTGLKNLDYGASGGLGLSLPLGSMVALRAEGRYQYALQNAFSTSLTTLDSTASLKFSQVQFLAGLTFGGEMMK